jgi:hypothetical protein
VRKTTAEPSNWKQITISAAFHRLAKSGFKELVGLLTPGDKRQTFSTYPPVSRDKQSQWSKAIDVSKTDYSGEDRTGICS